ICGLLPAVATAPPERPSLSLHDALPIYKDLVAEVRSLGIEIKGVMSTLSDEEADRVRRRHGGAPAPAAPSPTPRPAPTTSAAPRSEEHTSELQSREKLVCRLLLEKQNQD